MSQYLPQASYGQASWKDVRTKAGSLQLSTRVKIICDENGKRKSQRSEPATFNPRDNTQYECGEAAVLCDGGRYRLPYYKPGPFVISQHLSHSTNMDGSESYRLVGQGEKYQSLREAASQLAFTKPDMDHAAIQGIDSGKWTVISTKTMQGKNGDSVTVVSSARVFAAGTELDDAVIIPVSPAFPSMSGAVDTAQSRRLSSPATGSRKRQKSGQVTLPSQNQRSIQRTRPQYRHIMASSASSNRTLLPGPEVASSQPSQSPPQHTEERLLYPTTSTPQPYQVANRFPPDRHIADYKGWLQTSPSMKPWPSVNVPEPVNQASDESSDADGSDDDTQR